MRHLAIMSVLGLCLTSMVAEACITRSGTQRRLFAKQTACPSTQLHKLPCPGYIIDHTIALCVKGKDHFSNMQWQTIADAKAKDRWECKK